MNKKLLSIALAITIGVASCSDDECNHTSETTPLGDNPIEGSWYVEDDNEEVSYSSSGTFYDRYSNVELSGETEGRYEYNPDNMKLTYRYYYLGNNVQDNWTVKNLSEFGFTLSSTYRQLVLRKIVEQYTLSVGETAQLTFDSQRADVTVSSYSSNNSRIVSVSSTGKLTAMGEKGTTYVRMSTNVGDVWAKVTVGDDNKDLWCDYVSVIGANYSTASKYFSRLGTPASDGEGYFSYILSVHQYIESVNVLYDQDENFVTAIKLYLREGVSAVEINSYLKSRFYTQEDNSFYTTMPELEESKAIISYNEDDHCVLILETQSIIHHKLWYDFTKLFGYDKDAVKKSMDKAGYSFIMSDYGYSENGSDYYSIEGDDYMNMVGFVFNPDNQMSECWAYYNKSNDVIQTIYKNLCRDYVECLSEETNYIRVFYNEDKSIKVTLDLESGAVVYNNQTMKQHVSKESDELFGSYEEALGLTQNQVIEKFGNPYSSDETSMFYLVGSDYVTYASMTFDSSTGKCKYSTIVVNDDNVDSSTVLEYLGAKYVVFEKGTAADHSQYAWTNGATFAESTMGIIYFPADNMIIYQSLNTASSDTSAEEYSMARNNAVLNRLLSRMSEVGYASPASEAHLKKMHGK